MPINDPRHLGAFDPERGRIKGEEDILTADEEFKLEGFEKDMQLMRYVGLNDEGARIQMEKLDPTLKMHAEEYKRLKVKAEKLEQER